MILPTTESMRILVVDDSATMRQMLGLQLKQFRGAKITDAVDGVDAVRKLQAEKFDIVLTDINMPLMDGLKLVGFIRQNADLKNLPIIIITTRGADEDRDRGLALGANAYVNKPVQPSQLVKAVMGLLKPAPPA
jgi:two-component system chemotaxis response regulator CheY